MRFDSQDEEVIRLLTRLKEADREYPQDLLAARRQRYLKRMGEIGLGIGTGLEIERAVESVKPPTPATVTSTLLETALVVAIVVEASAVAYFYREKLADLFQTITTSPEIQEIISPPGISTPAVAGMVTPSPVIPSTILLQTISESPTETMPTPTRTPSPAGIVEETSPSSGEATQVSSTLIPNGNNGNHYGQTPKPERTKENNGNNDRPPRDNNDNGPPPRDNDNKPPP
ncbi:MAG TPA: hypothetical protein VMN99_08105 [Anaerolineales bacterium]|nr:hypothetical protein [Anaerolineales bacterium]